MQFTQVINICDYSSNYKLFKYLTTQSNIVYNRFNYLYQINHQNNILIHWSLFDKIVKYADNLNNTELLDKLNDNQLELLNQLIGFNSNDVLLYRSLPSKSMQYIIKQVYDNWYSYDKSLKKYTKSKKGYRGEPQPPKAKYKNNERNIIVFNDQQFDINNNRIDNLIPNYIKNNEYLSNNNIKYHNIIFNLFDDITINQIRIIPKKNCFNFEIVYTLNYLMTPNLDLEVGYNIKKNEYYELNKDKFVSLDLGVNNFCAITNNFDFDYKLICGRILKSINQHTNKLISNSKRKKHSLKLSQRMVDKIWYRRDEQIRHYFNKVSNWIINYCLENVAKNLVIGYNKGWKQKVKLGKKNNQNFVNIPYYKFKCMLEYKCEISNINLIEVNESYTSKCSFLDLERLVHKEKGKNLGKRDKKLYTTKEGYKIHADINGSLNILRLGIEQYNKNNDIEREGLVWYYKGKQMYLECLLNKVDGQVVLCTQFDNDLINKLDYHQIVRGFVVSPIKVKIKLN